MMYNKQLDFHPEFYRFADLQINLIKKDNPSFAASFDNNKSIKVININRKTPSDLSKIKSVIVNVQKNNYFQLRFFNENTLREKFREIS